MAPPQQRPGNGGGDSSLPVSRGSAVDSELDALMRAHPERTRELLYGLYNIPAPGGGRASPELSEAAAAAAAGPKASTGKSHYQDTFTSKELRKRSSKRPKQPAPLGGDGGYGRDRRNKAAMSFDTCQRADYVPKDLRLAKNEPVRKSEDAGGAADAWRDQPDEPRATVYQEEFKERPLGPLERRKPGEGGGGGGGRVMVANGQFHGETTAMADFKGWSSGRNAIRYGELPVFMGSVLNPGAGRSLETVNQSTYRGPRGVPAAPAAPAIGNITLDGELDFRTVNRDTYRPMPAGARREPPARVSNEVVLERKLPMHSETQTRADYKGHDATRFKRSEKVRPPGETVDLRYDRKGYWNTEQRQEFRGVDVKQHPVPASFKKDPSQYSPPEGHMEGESTSHMHYKQQDIREAYRERVKPPVGSTRFAGKFSGETTNSEAYRAFEGETAASPRQRHGDFHMAYHSVPKFDRLEGESETRASFVPKPLAPTESFKPVVTAAPTDGERSFDTVHRTAFRPPRFRLTREQAVAVKAELRRLEATRRCHPALLPPIGEGAS